ncbi:hypothetical protein CDAR_62671 [Caerostris darwini]|uniref:Uncharacterized protein n=1 Tax=Caerostris darwini TaxID=1538125 RepID=A0AAV4UF63_9ARAC|nr:hypothetical protein CDAR_62671 [Caerostris darwini]
MNNVYQKDHGEWLACRVRQMMPIGTVSGTKNSAESFAFHTKDPPLPKIRTACAPWRILFAAAAPFSKRGGWGRTLFIKCFQCQTTTFLKSLF